jgi:uncharacterized protein (TIGR02271 family)
MEYQYHQSIVAVFDNRSAAESARNDLIAAGVSAGDVQIRDAQTSSTGTTHARPTPTRDDLKKDEPGFFEWLFGADSSSSRYGGYGYEDRYRDAYAQHNDYYRQAVTERGRTILTVTAIDDEREYNRICDAIERHNPIDVDAEGGEQIAAYHHPEWQQGQADGTYTSDKLERTTRNEDLEQAESRIPIAKEELHVGKRQIRRAKAYRIRTEVKEVPVEQDVRLRDEKVTIERRPTSGTTTSGDAFRERTVEVHEMHEEPVVEKRVKAQEEVVVRKEVGERVEKVRDTVRETKVDIDRAAAGDKPQERDTGPLGPSRKP